MGYRSFTPRVFRTIGEMGTECELFVKTLAEQLARKNGGNYGIVVAFLRTRLSFGILTSVDSVHMSERGWRVPFKKRNASGFFSQCGRSRNI